jgi:succinyl-CoA synthetase beta subunit
LGVSRDEQFGPVLMLGLGGIWTEALQRVAVRPLPVCRFDVLDMVSELKIGPLILGHRGQRKSLFDLETVILALSQVVLDLGENARSIEINPLVLNSAGAIAADARLSLD